MLLWLAHAGRVGTGSFDDIDQTVHRCCSQGFFDLAPMLGVVAAFRECCASTTRDWLQTGLRVDPGTLIAVPLGDREESPAQTSAWTSANTLPPRRRRGGHSGH